MTTPEVFTDGDRLRLHESRHDIDAVADAGGVTLDPVGRAAVEQTAGLLAVERAGLLGILALLHREGTETSAARVSAAAEVDYARAQLLFLRRRAEAALAVDPDAPAPAAEQAASARVFGETYTYTAKSLDGLSGASLLPIVEAMIDRLPATGDKARLGVARDRLLAAQRVIERERVEDRAVFAQVDQARARIDRVSRAHALTVEARLGLEDRDGELGRYILAQDTAYKARRRAKRPAAEEPGIDAVDQEVADAAPAPLEAPPA